MTVAAMRRASRIRRGMVCASERASPLARCVALISCLSARCLTAAMRLSDARLELTDDAFHGLAVGARGERERHAVLEDRLRHGEDVVDRWRQPPVDEGAGARHQHQRLARARARAPGDQLADLAALAAGARRAHEVEDRFHHRFADRQAAHQALCRQELIGGHGRLGLALFRAGGVEHDFALGIVIGIVDVDLHQEAVELRLGQGIGAFLLDRILRREHVEGARNVVTIAGNRHVVLLHGLQQRGLGARACAVDFVGHQQLPENRARDEAKAALSAGTFVQHFAAQNVGRHEVRGELDAAGVKPEHDAHGLDQLGLGEAGKADEQRVPATEHGDERLLDHRFLPEDHVADRGLGGGDLGAGRFRLAYDHVLELFQPIGCYRHDISSLSSIYRPARLLFSLAKSSLTKKHASFGPRAHWAYANPSQLLEITLFFTGCDSASAQLYHDLLRTPAGPTGRECLNSLSFFGPAVAGQEKVSSLPPRAQGKTAGRPHKFQAHNGRRGSRLHSTHREAASASKPWPRGRFASAQGARTVNAIRARSKRSFAPSHGGELHKGSPAFLALTAIGVVFGDIGTSPLHTLSVTLGATGQAPPAAVDVLGIVSLIFWALMAMVSLKYVVLVLRADNDGEGGILALLSLVESEKIANGPGIPILVLLGIVGAALLYGDGVITPAISVLSAIEGLKLVAGIRRLHLAVDARDPGRAVHNAAAGDREYR